MIPLFLLTLLTHTNSKDAATTTAQTLATHATNIASYTGLTTSPVPATVTESGLPPDSQAGQVLKMDTEGLAVFAEKGVRHDILVKINKLAV
jgi:hypothetical protein